jgi:CheY-like chemotaxis protein
VVPPQFEIGKRSYIVFFIIFYWKNPGTMSKESQQRKHIVLADDDADDRELFIEAITEIDPSAAIVTVEDGDKLMLELKTLKATPDLIFLDVNMPRKSGKECIAEIKRDPRLNQVPIVIYSTTLNKKDIDDAWNKGALCFMRKPDSYTKLKSILGEIVSTDFKQAERDRTQKILFNL